MATRCADRAGTERVGSVKEAIGKEAGDAKLLPLHVEEVSIGKRARKAMVRAKIQTITRDELVRADLTQHRVVVERVPVGRTVDAVPPVRQDGDVTVVPVVEEVVVIERRLVLKEEIHLRRVRTVEPYSETVTLREQQVTLTWTEIED